MMEVHFIAQSGFIIEYMNQRIAIDLWANNPINPVSLDKVPKIDHVFVTHDHGDHDLNLQWKLQKGIMQLSTPAMKLPTVLLKTV